MITIDNNIPVVVPVKNPVLLKGSTDNFETSSPSNQFLTFQFALPTTLNTESWFFKCGTLEFEWQWVASPDTSGYQMPANLANNSSNLLLLQEAFNMCPALILINCSTLVFSAGPSIFVTFEKAPDLFPFELEFVLSTYPFNNGTIQGSINDIASQQRVIRQDFRVICALYENTIQTGLVALARYKPIAQIDSNPNNQNEIGFNLAHGVRSMVNWFMPDVDSQGFGPCIGMSAQYLASVFEQWFDGQSQKPAFLIDLFPGNNPDKRFIALHAGMLFKEFDPVKFVDEYCTNGPDKKFLTYRPRISTFHESEPIWLYFFLDEDIKIDLYVKLYLANGTIDDTKLTTYEPDISEGVHIHYVPCGVANNEDIKNFIGVRDYTKIEVWLNNKDDDSKISETMTFIREDRDWEHINYILFESPLGGLDTFRITGNIVSIDFSSGEVAQLGRNQLENKEFFKMLNNISNPGVSINTGWRSLKSEIEWARQIQNSENVFLLENGKLHNLILDRKEQRPFSLKNSLYSLEFNAKFAYYDRA